MSKGKVYFVGAGPGDPELITIKGRRIIDSADFILYTGSLVHPALFRDVRPGVVVADSSGMTLPEILEKTLAVTRQGGVVARVHTGDPTVYSAMTEQMAALDAAGVDYAVVPGVGSVSATAAALRAELTIPEVCQTVILTRVEGRTPMPTHERLRDLATHQATMAFFLSASLLEDVVQELRAGGYPPETPAAIAYKVTWEEEQLVRTTLANVVEEARRAGITKHAMILVGAPLGDVRRLGQHHSKLYDETFSHGFRRARATSSVTDSPSSCTERPLF